MNGAFSVPFFFANYVDPNRENMDSPQKKLSPKPLRGAKVYSAPGRH